MRQAAVSGASGVPRIRNGSSRVLSRTLGWFWPTHWRTVMATGLVILTVMVLLACCDGLGLSQQ